MTISWVSQIVYIETLFFKDEEKNMERGGVGSMRRWEGETFWWPLQGGFKVTTNDYNIPKRYLLPYPRKIGGCWELFKYKSVKDFYFFNSPPPFFPLTFIQIISYIQICGGVCFLLILLRKLHNYYDLNIFFPSFLHNSLLSLSFLIVCIVQVRGARCTHKMSLTGFYRG